MCVCIVCIGAGGGRLEERRGRGRPGGVRGWGSCGGRKAAGGGGESPLPQNQTSHQNLIVIREQSVHYIQRPTCLVAPTGGEVGAELVMFPGTGPGGASPTPYSPGPGASRPFLPSWESEVGKSNRGVGGVTWRGRLEIHPLRPYQRVEGRGFGSVGHVVAIALRAAVGAPIAAQRCGRVELMARGCQQPALIDRAVHGCLGRGGRPGVGQRAAT